MSICLWDQCQPLKEQKTYCVCLEQDDLYTNYIIDLNCLWPLTILFSLSSIIYHINEINFRIRKIFPPLSVYPSRNLQLHMSQTWWQYTFPSDAPFQFLLPETLQIQQLGHVQLSLAGFMSMSSLLLLLCSATLVMSLPFLLLHKMLPSTQMTSLV